MLTRITNLSKRVSHKISYNYGQLTFTSTISPISQFPRIPTYRLIDLDGKLIDKSYKYDAAYLSKILKTMIFVDEMDKILLKIKQQGKISFYMGSQGERACIVGSAAGLQPQDWIYTQYRQQGAFIWRGFTIDQIINQCIGNVMDGGKGRQMPVHYGSKQLNMITVSSPLTTQVPQAVGTGYAFRTSKQNKVCGVYIGEGAASEGDFATSLNFAATLKAQTLFFLRNNKYAISTPTQDQYASDGVIPRAISMGIDSVRVDGNDALACLQATKYARKFILDNKKPFFIQFMTYRISDHSTSDNSVLYRKQDERNFWRQKNNPTKRLINFLKSINYNNAPKEEQQRQIANKIITESFKKCQKYKFPTIQSMFDDVYDKLPKNLQQQKQQLKKHLQKYADKYQYLGKFES